MVQHNNIQNCCSTAQFDSITESLHSLTPNQILMLTIVALVMLVMLNAMY
jgi:hypothetical protein